jgi:hypothetical protein
MGTSDHLLNDVTRVLVWYSNKDDSFVAEHALEGIDLEQLKALFKPPPGDPLMYDSYPVGRDEAALLGKVLGISIDLDHFDYFVECDAPDAAPNGKQAGTMRKR